MNSVYDSLQVPYTHIIMKKKKKKGINAVTYVAIHFFLDLCSSLYEVFKSSHSITQFKSHFE